MTKPKRRGVAFTPHPTLRGRASTGDRPGSGRRTSGIHPPFYVAVIISVCLVVVGIVLAAFCDGVAEVAGITVAVIAGLFVSRIVALLLGYRSVTKIIHSVGER